MMQLILLVATIIGAAGAAAYLCDRRRRLKIRTHEKSGDGEDNLQLASSGNSFCQGRKEKLQKFEKRLDKIAEKYRKEGD